MGKPCNNLKELEAEIMKSVKIAMDKEVSQVVKESIQTSVSSEIYSWGQPVKYIRRNLRDGSLGDTESMNHSINSTGSEISLEVWDESKSKMPWDRDLTEAIVHGYGNQSEPWNEPRDFIEEARNILREDKSYVECLKDTLRAMGLTVV